MDGESINFGIEERHREEPRTPTAAELAREKREYGYHAPRINVVPTGALRVVRLDIQHYWSPRRKSWYDHHTRRVATQIPKILASFHELAAERKAQRAEEERQRLIREEQERIQRDRQERRAAHAELRSELERQAGAWHRARFLRRYITVARRSLPEKSIKANFRSDRIDFLDWATDYVNQLDPLAPTPLNPDLWPERTTYAYPSEDGLKKLLLRLTGFDGHPHKKVTALDDTDQV